MIGRPDGTDRAARPGILLVTQYYPPERGAAQVRLSAVVAALQRRGHPVDVVTAVPNYPLGRFFDGWRAPPVQQADEGGTRITRVWVHASMGSGLRRILNYLSFGVMSVPGLLSRRRPRWVVVEYPTLPGALPAVVWARLTGRRVVLLVADLWVDAIASFGVIDSGPVLALLRRVERWMLRRCDVVTAVTEGVRAAIEEKGVDPARVAWLPNGVDTEMFSPSPDAPPLADELSLPVGTAVFVYAGTHGFVHGLDVVLDAATLLRDEPVHFLLVGHGSEKERLVERARELGLRNVTFHDPVAPEEVARLLRGATGGLATVREGDLYRSIRSAKSFPVMAAARPLVYSGDDEGSALVASIGAGIATPPGDAAALAGAVRAVASDPAAAAAFGLNGRRWVEANAGWDGLVASWLEEVGEVTGRSGELIGPASEAGS